MLLADQVNVNHQTARYVSRESAALIALLSRCTLGLCIIYTPDAYESQSVYLPELQKAAEGSFGDIVALFGANVSAEDICRIVNKSKRRPVS